MPKNPNFSEADLQYPELHYRKVVAEFAVLGDPVGYYARVERDFRKMSKAERERAKRYHKYKDYVQAIATSAGLVLPLQASREKQLFVSTICFFRNGVHFDPGNVQKGVCDSLFRAGQGAGDKQTGGFFYPPMYDAKNPRVIVEVWEVGTDQDRRMDDGKEEGSQEAGQGEGVQTGQGKERSRA